LGHELAAKVPDFRSKQRQIEAAATEDSSSNQQQKLGANS
jgi:hypothetical protein